MHNVKDWAVVSHSPSPARRRCCGCWAERLRGSAACSGVYRGLEQYSDKTPRAATRWCLWAPSSTAPAESKTVQHWPEEVKGHLQTDFTYYTCRVFNRRPFRKMGKLTKLLYLVTTSAKQSTVTSVSFFSKHVMFYVNVWGFEGCTPLTRSSDENSLQSSLRWSTILVPGRTPEASAISNTPEL